MAIEENPTLVPDERHHHRKERRSACTEIHLLALQIQRSACHIRNFLVFGLENIHREKLVTGVDSSTRFESKSATVGNALKSSRRSVAAAANS